MRPPKRCACHSLSLEPCRYCSEGKDDVDYDPDYPTLGRPEEGEE